MSSGSGRRGLKGAAGGSLAGAGAAHSCILPAPASRPLCAYIVAGMCSSRTAWYARRPLTTGPRHLSAWCAQSPAPAGRPQTSARGGCRCRWHAPSRLAGPAGREGVGGWGVRGGGAAAAPAAVTDVASTSGCMTIAPTAGGQAPARASAKQAAVLRGGRPVQERAFLLCPH